MIRRPLGLVALCLALLGCSTAPETDTAGIAPWGLPEVSRDTLAGLTTHVLLNPGFAIGYSEWRASPLWAVYRLTPIHTKRDLPRPRRFQTDPRTLRQVDPRAFGDSGYQRGHLAPNYAISQLYGVDAQRATFLMSNVAPQRRRLNQKWWQRLEEVAIDRFTPRFGELWVITGPVFPDPPTTLPDGVDIPGGFYKILLRRDAGTWRGLAFLAPQTVRGDEPLDEYLVSIDTVEALTGLDFLRALPDAEEVRLEAGGVRDGWGLAEVARLPPRY